MSSFSYRSQQVELMDDLACNGEVVDQTLKELEKINTLLGGNKVTERAIKSVFKKFPDKKEWTIIDLGCGGGDMLRNIDRLASTHKKKVSLIGVDANPFIIDYARNNLKDLPNVEFHALSIFSDEFRRLRFDVAIGTLFFHHFSNQELISFFSALASQVTHALIINDIHRHPLAYHSIKILTRLFSKSPMVVHDAPVSVMRAFNRSELSEIFQKAGFSDYSISWNWAFRWKSIVYFEKLA